MATQLDSGAADSDPGLNPASWAMGVGHTPWEDPARVHGEMSAQAKYRSSPQASFSAPPVLVWGLGELSGCPF